LSSFFHKHYPVNLENYNTTGKQKKEMGEMNKFQVFTMLFLLLVVSGCTAVEKKENMEEVETMQNIMISTEAFREGDTIPPEYTCDGKDISPMLSWNGVPSNAKSIALIMDDPDAPGGTFVHWVFYNIPANVQNLSKGMPGNETLADGSLQGMTDFGRTGYGGPCPPPGKPHRYYFKIFALDTKLDLSSKAKKTDVERAMEGHVLARGELMGKYGR
jgi:Raf kinase inhibitor-like YbhB/YbcL family protein